MSAIEWARSRRGDLLDWFVLLNLTCLAGDIVLAHAVNAFAHWAEWIPLVFSLVGGATLGAGLVWGRRRPRLKAGVKLGVGGVSVGVGVAGFLWHLESQFFVLQSLHSLVYTAPFVAPLAYSGLGLLLWLNVLEEPGSRVWSGWVVVLALGGVLGNFVLSVCDHAQNGFFVAAEWVPVCSSALAVGVLLAALRDASWAFFRWVLVVMALQVVVGVVGFAWHLHASWSGPGEGLVERVVYGAPALAPLLFADLAVLSVLGAWSWAEAQHV